MHYLLKKKLKEKNNLILNVDGTIGATILDIFENSNFSKDEIEEILSGDILNGFFIKYELLVLLVITMISID